VDENGTLLSDIHNILNTWKDCFSELLNMRSASYVGQIQIHAAEPLVPGPSLLEVAVAFAKLKKYKSRGSDQMSVELIQTRSETF
jgi:hypothetical protein